MDVPEDAHPVVAHNRVRRDALDGGAGHVVGVDIADEGVGGILRQRLLELLVIRPADRRVVGLAGQGQIFVRWSSRCSWPPCRCRRPYKCGRPRRRGSPSR